MQQKNTGTMESLEDFRHFSEKELEARFEELEKQIVPADKTIREQAEKHWERVAKPLGSLGVLEEDIVRAAAAQGESVPVFSKRALLIFCADNGVVEEGVSQTGQEVTAAVVSNMTRGRSCSCLMAERAGTDVFPIDMGIACEVEHQGELHPLTERSIRRGTSNFTKEAAMTRQEVLTAVLTGIDAVRVLKEQGYRLFAVGEMGIGNTTTSSAVASVLLQKDPELVTGYGAGLDSAGLKRKTEAIRRGIKLHHPDPMDGMEVLQKVGGFDLAAMAGAFLGGAIYHVTVVIDGVIAAAAAAAAGRMAPAATDYMLAAHVSAEPASIWLLDLIGVTPAIQAGLRLGEGTGALALFPLLDMALSIYRDMDTFAEMEIEAYKPLV